MVQAVWRVFMTEYERGWGQRPDGHRDFQSRTEADAFVKSFNAQNNLPEAPDEYSVAETPKLVEVAEQNQKR